MKFDNILQTIGNTPHVRINRLFGRKSLKRSSKWRILTSQ